MRAILIDWLVQVSLKFRLLQETMYMTVGIIDRFLQVSCCNEPRFDAIHEIQFALLQSWDFLNSACGIFNRTTQSPRSSSSWLE